MIYLLIFSIIILIISIILFVKTHKINVEVDKTNLQLEEKQKELILNNNKFSEKIISKQDQLTTISKLINQEQEQLKNIQDNIQVTLDNNKKLSLDAFNSWWDNLEKSYINKEQEFDENVQKIRDKSEKEVAQIQQDLDKIRQTRAAAIQAALKEKEIQANKDDYRLNISSRSEEDIRLLKSIQYNLSIPSVVDKIIWSNYYQPLAKTKFPKILKHETACGIYKITSLKTGMIYIGQSVDVCDRWKQHCKNALGVGTATSENKLYKAMREDGLYNFTFELIESCPQAQLNEKEKFYIDLYDSYNFGLNSTKGNK